MKKSNKILSCRICENTKLVNILNFGKSALGNDLQLKANNKPHTFNLKLNQCCKCGHMQLSESVNPKILYAKNYSYLSGISESFLKHFDLYSSWIIKKINLKKNSLVLDIGSNDGSCLNFFQNKGMRVVGIDPAKKPVINANKNNIFSYNNFFNAKSAKKIMKKFGSFNLITSHNVFAHIEDFGEILNSANYLLKKNGYLCFEVGYLGDVIKNNYFDTIYHEHLDYHHANPLKIILNRFGFSIINFYFNKIQGGSIRVLAKKKLLIKNSKKVDDFCNSELSNFYFQKSYIKNWQKRVESFMNNLESDLLYYFNLGYKIIAYGAPTKATIILKLLGNKKKLISFCIDDNHLKQNRFLPNTNIKICNSKILEEYSNHKIAFLVFAWNFQKDILKKLDTYKLKTYKVFPNV